MARDEQQELAINQLAAALPLVEYLETTIRQELRDVGTIRALLAKAVAALRGEREKGGQ
jgi:hypothetical protein